MLDAIRHASANLHCNLLLRSFGVPPGLIDPEPIEPLGNEDGWVLPEEKEIADSMAEVNAIIAAKAAEEKAARG